MNRPGLVILFLLAAVPLGAQQVSDPNFQFEHTNPAYPRGEGPVVCIDEAHHNFHTAEGRYRPFADLLRGDGYTVNPFTDTFTSKTLILCRVLVIANAVAAENATPAEWSFPHPSAFAREEINELVRWIRGGGSLLFVVDHSPWPGAAADLGAVLGVAMLDGWTHGKPSGDPPDLFTLADGTLKPHPILEGRNPDERIGSVATFTGHAFQGSQQVAPLIVFGPGARGWTDVGQNFDDISEENWPRFSVEGWLHGATGRLGEGRFVLLGEAAMCTAQVDEEGAFGMNHPQAKQNAQFCLNAVHWLDALLE